MTENKPDIKHYYQPGYEYFSWDNEERDMRFFHNEQARDKYFQEEVIDVCLDMDGWNLEEGDMQANLIGKITGQCLMADRVDRPPAHEIDENGIDEQGRYWNSDHDWVCGYKLTPVPNQEKDDLIQPEGTDS